MYYIWYFTYDTILHIVFYKSLIKHIFTISVNVIIRGCIFTISVNVIIRGCIFTVSVNVIIPGCIFTISVNVIIRGCILCITLLKLKNSKGYLPQRVTDAETAVWETIKQQASFYYCLLTTFSITYMKNLFLPHRVVKSAGIEKFNICMRWFYCT